MSEIRVISWNAFTNYYAPGGIIFIATPSLDSWSARLLKNRWMEFKPEHLFYFDSSTLQTLLIDCGYKDIIEQPGTKALNVDYIAATLRTIQGSRAFAARRVALQTHAGKTTP